MACHVQLLLQMEAREQLPAPSGTGRGMGVIMQEAPRRSCSAADTRGWAPRCCWAARAATGHSEALLDGQAGHSAADTSLGQRACLPNPSWKADIFGSTVYLLAPLGYSVFQVLSEKENLF